MMVKEEKEQKLKKRAYIEKEYPPWPTIDTQDEEYLRIVRELNVEGLDPKQDISISSAKVTKLFGTIRPLKCTYPNLPEEDKRACMLSFGKSMAMDIFQKMSTCPGL